jgi:probable rRNA maturation factor
VPAKDISFHSDYPRFRLKDADQLKTWINKTILSEKKRPGALNFVFCTDEFLLDINRRFLKHDYYTDIITFDYSAYPVVSGDIYISTDRVKENAATEKQTFDDELHRVIIHGVLHLLGQQDKGAVHAKQMRKKEDLYLSLRSAKKTNK